MKKILTVFLMLILATSAVSAANETGKSTDLTFTVAQTYTWTAPAAVTFTGLGQSKTGTLSVTENVIPNGKTLKIKVATPQEFKVKYEDVSIDFTMKAGSNTLAAGNEILSLPAGTNTGSQEITFTLGSSGATKSGTYTGTVSFVATVE